MNDNEKNAVLRGCFSNSYQMQLVNRFKNQKRKPTSLEAIKFVVPAGKSIIDIGASIGRYFPLLREAGYKVSGIDGSSDIEHITNGKVSFFDLTSPRVHDLHGVADWGLFIEVGEHIPEKYEDTMINNVCQMPREGLIVSWARPGTRGRDHVNCRDESHVVAQFRARGWVVDKKDTIKARSKRRKKGQHMLVMKMEEGRR